MYSYLQDLVEYFEEIDSTFKDFLQAKSALFDILTQPSLIQQLSLKFDKLYQQFDNARGSCTQSIYKKCLLLIEQLEMNLAFAQKEIRSIGEALYSKTSSPHDLMEKVKVSSLG